MLNSCTDQYNHIDIYAQVYVSSLYLFLNTHLSKDENQFTNIGLM